MARRPLGAIFLICVYDVCSSLPLEREKGSGGGFGLREDEDQLHVKFGTDKPDLGDPHSHLSYLIEQEVRSRLTGTQLLCLQVFVKDTNRNLPADLAVSNNTFLRVQVYMRSKAK